MNKLVIYPEISIKKIKEPSRLFAFPLIGALVKIILLIPPWLELIILQIVGFFVLIIGGFYLLITGRYWKQEYKFFLGIMRLDSKIAFYFAGLTDTYPGFSLDVNEFTVHIACPSKPNRWFAFPIFGFMTRLLLLIPYFIYVTIIKNAVNIVMVISWIPVLFSGKYPETTYEIVQDSKRLSLAITSYIIGLSDRYPSFRISMNHKSIKIILIIAGSILFISQLPNPQSAQKISNTHSNSVNNSSVTR